MDPSGWLYLYSTDVRPNADGTYTVVNAFDDGDNGIYLVDENGNRTGDVIGYTMKPYDFMSTNNETGSFHFNALETGITFSLDDLTVSGSIQQNEHITSSIHYADAQKLLNFGQEVFIDEVRRQSPTTFYGKLEILRSMSANGGPLDFKTSLGVHPYTALRAGSTSSGLPIMTTLRAMGNMIFGANIRNTKPSAMRGDWYYRQVMKKVGVYNQSQNKGMNYNSGFPYFGEHTYSGSYIHYGYFGKFN
jgi:hypothetical protein